MIIIPCKILIHLLREKLATGILHYRRKFCSSTK